jgi:replicative DNA helicase
MIEKIKPIYPCNPVVEKAILSILINYPYSLKKGAIYLKPESFYIPEHKILFQTIFELYEQKKPITLTTILSYLLDNNLLEKVGGNSFLVKIASQRDPARNLMEYIRLLNEKDIRRKLVKLGEDLIKSGYEKIDSTETIFEEAEQKLFNIAQQQLADSTPSSGEILLGTLEELQRKSQLQEMPGYLSSYKDLDTILQGFQKSDVIVIAGRPSMGKTALALNLARNVVQTYKLPIIFFSLEMSKQQLMYRLLSIEAFVDGSKLRLAQMTHQEWRRIIQASTKLSELPIYVDDNPYITLNQMKAKIRNIFLEYKQIGLVIIDYLQLMKLNIKLENRVQEIAHITRNLKFIAKEFDLPLILLSQLSRNVESRVNKKPILSDLRESGCFKKSLQSTEFFQYWNGENYLTKSNPIIFKGLKPSYCFKLNQRKNLNLTGNHKLLANKGWIRLREINRFQKILFLGRSLHKIKKRELYFYPKSFFNIQYKGIDSLFDIEISNFHNFLEKKILIHNSIEQDADVVLMLYREDYYTNKKRNSRSIIEIIVAKHRNGPVGNINLIFDTNLTRFFD